MSKAKEEKVNWEEMYHTAEIAKELNVKPGTLRRFVNYCKLTQAHEIPLVQRGKHNRYYYTKEEKDKLVTAFKSRTWGEMADYHREYEWGEAYREMLKQRDK